MNSNPPTQRRLIITVDGPDIDALESSTHAQLQARALRKIALLILNFGQTLLSMSKAENQATSTHYNAVECSTRISVLLIIPQAV